MITHSRARVAARAQARSGPGASQARARVGVIRVTHQLTYCGPGPGVTFNSARAQNSRQTNTCTGAAKQAGPDRLHQEHCQQRREDQDQGRPGQGCHARLGQGQGRPL
jgi:hypothetical protein